MAKNNKLDKFYTQSHVAKECYDFLILNLPEVENQKFLEPSAGAGAFLPYLQDFIALDILPENNDKIQQQDFLQYESDYKNFITIGNPPFGNRSKLAIDFFNKAALISDVIAFIVPVSFMKWSVQKELSNQFKLVNLFYLNLESFTTEGKPFGVRTVFQIWIKKNSLYDKGQPDKRLSKQPPIKHEDFEIWQYNATPSAEKVIEEDWEYATYRQGYHNYNSLFNRNDYDFIKKKMTDPKGKQQFFFIKPLSEESKNIILSMDFNALAERNTSTPGFGKGDFVSYYIELKNK